MQALQLLILVVLAVGAATALDCYVCESSADFITGTNGCGDFFEKSESASLLKTCNATADERYCRKEKVGANNIWTKVKRSCERDCEESNTLYVKAVTCCEENGCNGATVVTIATSVLLLSTILMAEKYF